MGFRYHSVLLLKSVIHVQYYFSKLVRNRMPLAMFCCVFCVYGMSSILQMFCNLLSCPVEQFSIVSSGAVLRASSPQSALRLPPAAFRANLLLPQSEVD